MLDPNRWTLKTREAVNDATAAAQTKSHPEVTPDHLLLALIGQTDGVVLPVLQRTGVALPELRLIVATLIRSVPGMFNVLALMSIVFYVYGVAGYYLFRDVDPTHWRTLGISLLSLFRIVTLEDWTDIMYAALEHHWWAWAYFVSFVVVGTFVVINLFLALIHI